MKLFSKSLDYNLILEKVLDEKHFSANVKNLLLSMLYKIEISYKDYTKVKQIKKTKDDILNEIINIISEFFDLVKLVEPSSKQAKILKENNVMALTNEKERSLLAYPTELAMLYAIADIEPKFFYINRFIFKKEFQQMLVEGSNLNLLEILENFNGWSWDPKYIENKAGISNLIYQNLIMLFGLDYIEKCKKSSNKNYDIIEKIKKSYPEYYYNLINVIYLKSKNPKLDKIVKEKVLELSKIKNIEKYLEKISIEKKKLKENLKKIETLLNDKDLLNKSFKTKKVQNKKFKSEQEYTIWLKNEKIKILKRLKEILEIENPKLFEVYKKELEEYNRLVDLNLSLEDAVIELQKSFIKILNQNIDKISTKEDFINLIYKIRYYQNIYIQKDTAIKNNSILNEEINKILKKLVTKGTKEHYLKMCSYNINLNAKILIEVLNTKIVNLQLIKIKFEEQENKLIIEIFENDSYEKKVEIKYDKQKSKITIKPQKKIKVFI